jgi:hypothetical protein
MIILMGSLSTIFAIGIFKFGLQQSLTEWLTFTVGLLFAIVPFVTIGIALGYAISPKTLEPLAAVLLVFGACLSGMVPIQNPSFVKDLIVIFAEVLRANLPWFIPKTCLIKPPATEATALSADVILLDEDRINQEPLWQREPIITHGDTIKLVVDVISTNW